MKKLIASVVAVLGYFASTAQAFALQVTGPTDTGIAGNTPPGTILTSALKIIYVIAVVAVLFMLIFGAFQWIISGGDKEAVKKASDRITAALVGLGILALALVIVTILGKILNIDITGNFSIPTLSGGPTSF